MADLQTRIESVAVGLRTTPLWSPFQKMNAITVKTTAGNTVLVNWNNVNYVRPTESYFGEKYNEIHFAGQHKVVSTTETIADIKKKLTHE
jgi:hypothetical protein